MLSIDDIWCFGARVEEFHIEVDVIGTRGASVGLTVRQH